MKTQQFAMGLIFFMLAFSACREITVRTTVNSDGSFTRTITVSGDSSEAFKKELPYPVDASWKTASKKDTANEGKFIVTYTKKYKNSEELKAETGRDTSWQRELVRQTDIRKRFGFFYSYLEYKEVYSAANPFTALHYKDFFTKDDLLWLTRRHPVKSASDSIKMKAVEEKTIDYLVESASAELEKTLADGMLKLGIPQPGEKSVRDYHEKIRNALKQWNFRNAGELIDSCRVWTGNKDIDRLKELQPPVLQEFDRKSKFLENLLKMEDFHVDAEMPGLITETNSSVLNGNRVSWDVVPMAFLLQDFTMVTESRVINIWAFILSGMVLLGLIGLLVLKSRKR